MSWIDESYATAHDMTNLEYPQYTRPEEVKGMKVPDVLLSGHHKAIAAWKQDQTMYI
jgi:tRNA (guanine37-N1)-methyltransferase